MFVLKFITQTNICVFCRQNICSVGEAQRRKGQRRTLLQNKLSDYCLKKDEWTDRFGGWNSYFDVFFRILLLMNHTAHLWCSAGEAQLRKRQRRTLLRNKLSDYCLKKPELIYQSRMKGSICYCSVQSKVCSSSMLAKGMSMCLNSYLSRKS